MPRSPPTGDHRDHRPRHREVYDEYSSAMPRKPSYGSYRILCVSNLHYKVNDTLMRQALEDEFGRYGDITVKLTTDERGERVAYIYFRSYEEAKEARHNKSRMILFDHALQIEPIVEPPPQRPPRRRTPSPMSYRSLSPMSAGGVPPGRRRPPPGLDRIERNAPYGMHHYHHRPHHDGPPGPPHGPPFRRSEKKEKFPNYLHHIPPEDDDKATRTLFVGNLEVTISEAELKRIFERYGIVEDIDVKRPPPGQGNAYAFIKFLNLDMAHRAKVEMSGQYIGKFQCKIGYGKATPTTRIWVGGLGSWTSLTHLGREFDRFGAIRKIDYVKGDNHAYIQYDNIDAAQAAAQDMRGFPLGGPDKKLRVDFADPGPYNAYDCPNATSPAEEGAYRRNRNPPSEEPFFPAREDGEYSNGRKRPHTPDGDKYKYVRRSSASPDSKRTHSFSPRRSHPEGLDKEARSALTESVTSVSELAKCCPNSWNGSLVLKSSSFSAKMLLCSGDAALVDSLMKPKFLRITQRLRLDPSKLDDVQKRVSSAGSEGSCVMLTLAGSGNPPEDAGDVQSRPLRNLVTYLKQKEAAGVVPLPVKNKEPDSTPAVLYAFPPCDFAFDLLKKAAPNLADQSTGKDDYLVVVVVKGS